MLRTLSALVALCALSSQALAQANDPNAPQYQPPPQQQYQPPPQQQYQPPPQQPQQQPPQQQPPPQQGTAQQPPSGAGGSQQVVVNPPQQNAAPPPPSQPQGPNTAVTVNPPGSSSYGQSNPPVVIERPGDSRSSLEIVAIDAAFGALAGLLVGGGIALIANNDDWGRDLMIGTGAGILVGAAVGGIHAYNAADRASNRYATDGLGTPDKNPPLAHARTLVGYAGRF
jgi:hypothetical protein